VDPPADQHGEPIGCLYLGDKIPPHKTGRALLFNAYTRTILCVIVQMLQTPMRYLEETARIFDEYLAADMLEELNPLHDEEIAR
jgi:hypothetical protein